MVVSLGARAHAIIDGAARAMMNDELARLLAAGDVDALRSALKQQQAREQDAVPANDGPELPQPPRATIQTEAAIVPELIALRKRHAVHFRLLLPADADDLAVGAREYHLVDSRVMGKICWPAAEALAAHVLTTASRWQLPAPAVFLELAAGCALPSLVAAKMRVFSRVVTTDVTAERVAIAAHNAELNGVALEARELEFADCEKLVQLALRSSSHAEGGARSFVVCAADVHYNPTSLEDFFAAGAALVQRATARDDLSDPLECRLVLARSSTFAHNDEHMWAAARANRFDAVSTTEYGAAGVLHSASATLFEPNNDESVHIFTFAPQDAPEAAAPEAAPARAQEAQGAEAPSSAPDPEAASAVSRFPGVDEAATLMAGASLEQQLHPHQSSSTLPYA